MQVLTTAPYPFPTAAQGVAAAELAFQNSLWYCKERRSMRALSGAKDPEHVADSIIHHPSVRKMLRSPSQAWFPKGGLRPKLGSITAVSVRAAC
jgi:hypothetical protein